MTDFSQYLIKSYRYWSVYIHTNQGYLGRCVIWCEREDATDLSEATKEEMKELFLILKDLKVATEKAFGADWFNYAFLGNETRHLHGHFIPRYASKREFCNMVFEDKLWGKNYKTDKNFKTPDFVIDKVKEIIQKHLPDK